MTDFWFFIFLGFFLRFCPKFWAETPKMTKISGKNAENPQKNRKIKNLWKLRPSYVGGPPCQFLAQTGHPVAQKNEWREKWGSRFWGFSYTNGRKQPKTTLLWRIISRQPLRVERQMSPFWKLENQGYNIYQNRKNYKFWPWTPPPSPKVIFTMAW